MSLLLLMCVVHGYCCDFVVLQVLIQYCGVCLFYDDGTFLMSNSEHPVSSLPSSKPVRWVVIL